MTILVDMDDTMEQLLKAWLEQVNNRYDRTVAYEDIHDWDITLAYPGLTREQVYGVLLADDFWKYVEPMPHAPEVLKSFVDRGHDVYVVTATPYKSVPGKMEYHLFRHFPFLSWDKVIITSRKQLIRGDIMIVDGPHNLEGGNYHKILMDSPHNQTYPAEEKGMIRVYNWLEVDQIVKQIESGQ